MTRVGFWTSQNDGVGCYNECMEEKKDLLVLIDGHALAHRGFYAFPRLTSPSGEVVNAVYGFILMLINILENLQPKYLAVAFDPDGPTFRDKEFAHYKGTRVGKKKTFDVHEEAAKTKDELHDQIERIKEVLAAFEIPIYVENGFEADDVLGTIAKNYKDACYIATGDFDIIQLVDDKISVYSPAKGVSEWDLFTPEKVEKKYGLKPKQVIDFKALKGDPSDNIPGVPGVGDKTATRLIQDYGSLAEIYKHLAELPPKLQKTLTENRDQARLSQRLATIRTDVPLDFRPMPLEVDSAQAKKVGEIFGELGFKTLSRKLASSTFLNAKGQFNSLNNIAQDLEKPRDDRPPTVADRLDKALTPILRKMKWEGIKIDLKFLKKLSVKYGKRLDELTAEIYKYAKKEFNINSTQQLAEVLFEKLGLPTDGITKTKSGFSTAASELLKLRGQPARNASGIADAGGHPIIERLLEYRLLAKLKSTYIDALPKLADENSRVHTSLEQDTSTGRLSSKNPNLQNIPIRSREGREIRKAFIVEPENLLIAADYSQIELRIAASLSGDKKMIESFQKGEDIHSRTAAEITGKDISNISEDDRRNAKTVNFGILYGQGPRGLAELTGMGFAEAKDYIDRYFHLYPEIKRFMEKTKERAHATGYTETIFGRRRYYPNINSGVPFIRAANERMAVNAPIQGSAADLIKAAMIDLNEKLPQDAKMILQVHDELLFEVPEKSAKKIARLVKEMMERVHKLKVPIIADVKIGKNWGEMEKI